MKKFFSNRIVLYILGLLFLLLLWEILSLLIDESNIIFPSPVETFIYLNDLLKSKYTYQCIGYSFLRMIIGFLVAFILSLILGALSGISDNFRHFIEPLMTTLKAIPTASIVFFFIVIAFKRSAAPIYVVVLISLPILYESVVGGFRALDINVIEASKMDGCNKFRRTFSIAFPLSIPYIIVGVASSFSLSFKIEIMAEILTGITVNGLGSAIKAAKDFDPTNMTPIFAYTFIALIFIFIFTLFAQIIKKSFLRNNIVQNKK